ncbi:hypothetical protein Q2100_02930 [Mycolicibacterium sp. KC 300]|uniref:Uncharacterized protein n=1 Tax=Mycolicibacterium arseniciresistens TaxID=3062257 RepID=A0ABT8UE98_9MYCO|nr:hypothetical protein [Mycolicibacterium arseniciresistens]
MPDGEIAVSDLAAIGAALQELTTRIGREVLGTTGPGRTKRFMEELSALRLQNLTAGSTVLNFVKSPLDKLDVDLPEVREADDRFWQMMNAFEQNVRPDWVPDAIADSAVKLVTALKSAAPVAVIGNADGVEFRIEWTPLHVDTWLPKSSPVDGVDATGRLEKVDLRTHEFRVRDDIGQAVELRRVLNDAAAARLVGQWVLAHGEGTINASGRLVALNNVTVEPVIDPASDFVGNGVSSLDEILASAPGPSFDGGIELTDDEFNFFLRAARS